MIVIILLLLILIKMIIIKKQLKNERKNENGKTEVPERMIANY